jgi:hypothetical protein
MMAATLRQIGAAMTNVKSTRSIADRSVANKTRHDAICSIVQSKKRKELLRRSNA